MTQTPEQHRPVNNGVPRWLVIAIAVKMVIATAIVGAVVWWAYR